MTTLFTFLGLVVVVLLIFLITLFFYKMKEGKGTVTTLIFVLIMIMLMMVIFPFNEIVFDPDNLYEISHTEIGYALCSALIFMFGLAWIGIIHSTTKLTRKV